MSLKLIDQYLARAEDSRKAAAAATLDNVRERFLESETVWSELARRAVRVEAQREKLIADKRAEREAAGLPMIELEDEDEDEPAEL
jgi:hypothetical protein